MQRLNIDSLQANLFELKKYFLNDFNGYSSLKLISGGILSLCMAYTWKIWYSRRYFKKKGIKSPPIKSFIGGNLPEVIEKNYSEALMDWTKLYGKTYGYYEGHYPILVTSDIDLIQEIFIKQYFSFSGRKILPFQINDKQPDLSLFLTSGNRWRRMRAIINPTFVPARLKELIPIMRLCSDRLLRLLKENTDKEINVSEYLKRMSIDVVWNSAFGLDIDYTNNPNNALVDKVVETLDSTTDYHPIVKFLILFYETKPFFLRFLDYTSVIASKINKNLVQPLALLDNQVVKVIKERYEKKEISANCLNILFAGFETTNTTLNCCLYVLTQNPEEMRKLQEEIDACIQLDSPDEIDYDTLNSLEYLDLFIKETLRMYPPASGAITRRCTEKTVVNGLELDEDLLIVVDVLSLHYNPEYWGTVDPNVFYPLRFAKDSNINRKAYFPFGMGPKNCVGMKFSLLEVKFTLVNILKCFNVHSVSETPVKLEFRENLVRSLKNGLMVSFENRNL